MGTRRGTWGTLGRDKEGHWRGQQQDKEKHLGDTGCGQQVTLGGSLGNKEEHLGDTGCGQGRTLEGSTAGQGGALGWNIGWEQRATLGVAWRRQGEALGDIGETRRDSTGTLGATSGHTEGHLGTVLGVREGCSGGHKEGHREKRQGIRKDMGEDTGDTGRDTKGKGGALESKQAHSSTPQPNASAPLLCPLCSPAGALGTSAQPWRVCGRGHK